MRGRIGLSLVLCLATSIMPSVAPAETAPGFVLGWSLPNTFGSPYGIAVGPNDEVIVSNTDSLVRFSAVGGLRGIWAHAFGNTNGLVTAGGLLYVSDASVDSIKVFTPQQSFVRAWRSPIVFGCPFSGNDGIAADSLGHIFVHQSGSNADPLASCPGTPGGLVQSFTTLGTFITSWPAGPLAANLAADSAGRVFIASGGQIHVYSSSGTPLASWSSPGSAPGQIGGSVSGIACDRAGAVYICDDANSRIEKFSASGAFLSSWGSSGSLPGQFGTGLIPYIGGVAVDRAGNVFVLDAGNHRVQRFGVKSAAVGSAAPSEALKPVTSSPNPSMGGVRLSTTITHPGRVKLELVSVEGRQVRRWDWAEFRGGPLEVAWDGRDSQQRTVPPGVYFVRVTTSQGVISAPVIRLR